MARVAVVADSEAAAAGHATLLTGLGHEVWTAASALAATALVQQASPEAVLVAIDASSPELRAIVGRLRGAAERALPVILVLPDAAWWLRVAPSADLAPVAVVRRSGLTAAALAGALERLRLARSPRRARGSLSLDAARRRLTGPKGSVRLTPAEGALVRALLAAPGEVSDFAALCASVWDGAPPDQHRIVALRTHVHALRRKLAAVGAADALTSEPGRGYRLAAS